MIKSLVSQSSDGKFYKYIYVCKSKKFVAIQISSYYFKLFAKYLSKNDSD